MILNAANTYNLDLINQTVFMYVVFIHTTFQPAGAGVEGNYEFVGVQRGCTTQSET